LQEDTLETFQVLGVSSLGIWLGDGKGKIGRGINKTGMGHKGFCVPRVVAPQIGEDSVVGVNELV